MILYESCLAEENKETAFRELSHSYLIWEKLIAAIRFTKHYEVLDVIAKALSMKFEQLGTEKIIEICVCALRRLKEETGKAEGTSIWSSKCLIILRTVAKRLDRIKLRSEREFEDTYN